MKKKNKRQEYFQLELFTERNKQEMLKPWYMGIVCKQWEYFHFLACGIDVTDLSKPWEIEDYQNTKKFGAEAYTW